MLTLALSFRKLFLLVSNADNEFLTAVPSLAEVKRAVLASNGEAAPGPDGFNGLFYQHYWDIVGFDVYNSVKQFFEHGWLLPNLNSNLVVLIPKDQGADTVDKIRPIAMANFQFKIISKVLADRLAVLAPNLMSHNQCGFVKGRSIRSCIEVTSEAVNLLKYRTFGGNLDLKMIFLKAFDTLDWDFLLQVFAGFGFSSRFKHLISTILRSARLSFMVNGALVGFFGCTRGVRQGDPLSPLLFCLAEEVLSRVITKLVEDGIFAPMTGPRGLRIPSHAFFADDLMIFCNVKKQSLIALMSLFREYGAGSGQWLSPEKCTFYHGPIALRRIAEIKQLLGFRVGSLPFFYLGVRYSKASHPSFTYSL